MTANVDAMLRAAVEAIRANKKNDARALLEKVLDLDEYNEQAWIWLSAVVETTEEKRTCLENVLTINPNSEQAKKGLKQLGVDAAAPPPPVAPKPAPEMPTMTPAFSMTDDDDLFGDVGFGSAAATPAWGAATLPEDDDPWGSPTSSSSAAYDAPAEQSQIPDDWAASLVKKPSSTASSAFDDDAFFNDAPVAATQQDPFGADPFGNESFGNETFGADPFGADPFGSNAFNENDFDSMMNAPAPTPGGRFSPKPAAEEFEDIISKPVNEDFGDLFADDMVANAPRQRSSSQVQREPEEYFAQIPSEIKPGRLPGEDATLPSSARMMFIVAILLNVGAFGFLILKVMA